MVVAAALLGANANGEITDSGSPRISSGPRCAVLKVCDFPSADPSSGVKLSADSNVLCAGITSEERTSQFIAILGFGLFLTCFVGILTSKRLLAMAAGACLTTLAQILYISTEIWEGLDGSPLYPHVLLRVLSCGLGAGLAAAGLSFHLRPVRPPGAGHLLRAAVPALLAAVFLFEYLYFISRLPAISPVSLSLSFRPWTRIMSPTLVVFTAVWLVSLLCMLGDSCRAYPGQDGAADGTQGPEAR